jgi:hypothetical protein
VRHAVIKKYFLKHKYNKVMRDHLFKALEKSEAKAKDILKDQYVHYMDAIPEMK